jgi:hypothetical protein
MWWGRELQRRELSMLSPRDFGDLPVPQSLVTEEIRRWPWQKSSQQWGQVIDKRVTVTTAATGPCDAESGSRHRAAEAELEASLHDDN